MVKRNNTSNTTRRSTSRSTATPGNKSTSQRKTGGCGCGSRKKRNNA